MCKIKWRRYFWRECLWPGHRVTAGRSLSGKTPRGERLATLTLCRCRAPKFSPGTLTNIAIITDCSVFWNVYGHCLNDWTTGLTAIHSYFHMREIESAAQAGLGMWQHKHPLSPYMTMYTTVAHRRVLVPSRWYVTGTVFGPRMAPRCHPMTAKRPRH